MGGSPDAVDLYLNLPDEKSRGRGNIDGAAGPLPRPFGPWQTAQCRANTRAPSGAPRSKSAPGGQVRSAYCAGSGRYSALGCDRPTRAQMERPTSSASNSSRRPPPHPAESERARIASAVRFVPEGQSNKKPFSVAPIRTNSNFAGQCAGCWQYLHPRRGWPPPKATASTAQAACSK